MVTQRSLANKYYLHLYPGQDPIPWLPPDPHPLDWVDYTYFGKVFEAMEETLKAKDLTFYITWDNVEELPSYGSNVVAIIVGDEACRIPKYFHKVLAVFKCYGTRPILGCNPLRQPTPLNLMTLIQYINIQMKRFPSVLNYWLQTLKSRLLKTGKLPPIYELPLGYNKQLELPIKSLEDRSHDIFFAGSVVHRKYSVWSFRRWFGNPKSISRKQMIAALDQAQNKLDLAVELSITADFIASGIAGAESYSEKMMKSKICLVPRGTSFETFRFFEALRYGCIVITESLPSRWFYDGSPAIQIQSWNKLEEILKRLISDQNFTQEKHEQALHWWETKCSEAVVGNFIAEKLNALMLFRNCKN